jgi:hypothetical protein
MEADIVDGKIGSMGAYDVEFKGGKLQAKLVFSHPVGEATVNIAIGSDAVIEALKAAIPGKVDDAILEVLKSALKL